MKVIDSQEMKQVLLDMLSEFHRICEDNRLTYYLTGGTLLGAVRHKGFIPWDDDIDVLMPRSDYQKLLALSDKLFCTSCLGIVEPFKTPNYIYPYAKLVHNKTVAEEYVDNKTHFGIWIDIFPLDNMSNHKEKAESLFLRIKKFRNILQIKNIKNSKDRAFYKNLALTISKILIVFYSRVSILKKIDSLCRTYEDIKMTKYVCVSSVGTYGIKEIMESDLYTKVVPLEFEGYFFNAPVGYTNILSNLYGDFMKLPPIEKQVTHHSFVAYWKE